MLDWEGMWEILPFTEGTVAQAAPVARAMGQQPGLLQLPSAGPAARCQAQRMVLTHRVPEQSLPASEQGKQNS